MISAPNNFELLVEQHYESLYRFALSLSTNPSDAGDLTQQTFYIAQTKGHQLRDASKLRSWLSTTNEDGHRCGRSIRGTNLCPAASVQWASMRNCGGYVCGSA